MTIKVIKIIFPVAPWHMVERLICRNRILRDRLAEKMIYRNPVSNRLMNVATDHTGVMKC